MVFLKIIEVILKTFLITKWSMSKEMTVTNTLAHYDTAKITAKNVFLVQAPGVEKKLRQFSIS